MTSYEKVLASRGKNRLTAISYIENLITDFVELHGDRRYGDDSAIITGLGLLGGKPVTVVGIEKGTETAEKIKHNFGAAHPEGYRKALRQFKLAEKFNRPVICFVDTSGAFCGIDAEERGQGQAIAENLAELMTLKVPVISIIIGEGGSGGAIALAVADEVWMLSNAYYSVISPESCATILWKDVNKAEDAANALKITADDLYSFGIIEKICEEPQDFTIEEDREKFFNQLSIELQIKLNELKNIDTDLLLDNRYNKFRKIGKYEENSGFNMSKLNTLYRML
ncbi:MAG: acetyl-CoA carboxylase carboxyltransferase subunit alpha [Lachnospiraceae bacterium]|nr:acetyl-CoA carboxylase carboxyltransferase subunit alpha [Lachnospiraceae bacterium]